MVAVTAVPCCFNQLQGWQNLVSFGDVTPAGSFGIPRVSWEVFFCLGTVIRSPSPQTRCHFPDNLQKLGVVKVSDLLPAVIKVRQMLKSCWEIYGWTHTCMHSA